MRIQQINLRYHSNINKYITSSSVDTLIPLARNVALATMGETPDDTEDREGNVGGILGYVPTGED